jgi:hypothetical protein
LLGSVHRKASKLKPDAIPTEIGIAYGKVTKNCEWEEWPECCGHPPFLLRQVLGIAIGELSFTKNTKTGGTYHSCAIGKY